MSAKSLTLLVGEAGTGKTTLISAALESDRCRNVHCVYLNNPTLTAADFVTILARRFELGAEAEIAKSVLLERLEGKLRDRRSRGEVTALVVDEAQSLSTSLLEEIRLLANIETPEEKLLPLVLAGQPELAERLEQPELRQLKQRVALRCELAPFELEDTAAYIASRITTAGGVPAQLFSQEAVRLIHQCSSGIPRTISVICDNALLSGMALERKRVDSALVAEVCRELRLTLPPDPVPASTPEPVSGAEQQSEDGSAPQPDPSPDAPRGPPPVWFSMAGCGASPAFDEDSGRMSHIDKALNAWEGEVKIPSGPAPERFRLDQYTREASASRRGGPGASADRAGGACGGRGSTRSCAQGQA